MSGIYIHIPFCKQACHYCDFHFSTSLKYKEKMLLAIQQELLLRAAEFEKENIETIYFGGGTPSLLTQVEIDGFLDVIYQNYTVVNAPEITLEANPDDLSEATIIALSKSRINRLSIGIQSFFEEDLTMMNRAHTALESESCIKIATQYFDNITVDLIYGIPNMSVERWQQNLEKVFAFGINHISCYALTVEEKTALASFIKNKTYPPVDEELALNHFTLLVAETKKQGFEHYEISNFGKPNYYSKHNTSYWKGKRYVGVGPSAHSYFNNSRFWNVSNNAKYIKAITENTQVYEEEELSISDRFNETVMIGLRTVFGVDFQEIEQELGAEYTIHLLKESQKYIENKTLVLEKGILKTTQKGKFLADGIAAELFYID